MELPTSSVEPPERDTPKGVLPRGGNFGDDEDDESDEAIK